MSSATKPAESVGQSPLPGPTPSKKKNNKNKKKKNANKAKPGVEAVETNNNGGGGGAGGGREEEEEHGVEADAEPEVEAAEADDLSDEPAETPALKPVVKDALAENDRPASSVPSESKPTNGHAAVNGHAIIPPTTPNPVILPEATAAVTEPAEPAPASDAKAKAKAKANGSSSSITTTTTTTMSQDGGQAGEEGSAVEQQLRKQLQDAQAAHEREAARLRTELEESEAAKERAEAQYEALVERVEKIKATLADRLKSDRAELESANQRIEELETQNDELRRARNAADAETARLRDEVQEQGRELVTLRSRSTLSQQNWVKEKEELTRQTQLLRGELESTSSAMGEWEVIAMEERSVRESLADKVADLEEQVAGLREAYERAASDRDTQSQAVDGLQRALGEIQEARKRELRDMVESSEEQLQAMKARARDADSRADAAEAARETLAREMERMAPFEREVKEKNLLIGKLRHEAIVLNDHLTKALKYIKKTRPEETIDRQIVTNHFLQFLALDRSDPKKFQILQVIAGLLDWTDEQREQAGLARPGTASNSLRLPTSPFHRTPSSPALSAEFFTEPTSASGKESLADLWAGFLERSVEEAGRVAPSSRKDSMSSVTTAITRPDTRGG